MVSANWYEEFPITKLVCSQFLFIANSDIFLDYLELIYKQIFFDKIKYTPKSTKAVLIIILFAIFSM